VAKKYTFDTCTAGTHSFSGGQGAPIAITKVESIPQKDKVRFIITVENVGGGRVIDVVNVGDSKCAEGDFERQYYDIISLDEAYVSSDIPLECKPEQDIRLVNNKATIVCTADIEDHLQNQGAAAYKSVLDIMLRYRYQTMTQTSLNIIGKT
jgi:hypothetical protein